MASHRPSARTLPLVLFFSGAAALIYQVVWVRQLSMVMGTSLDAVAIVLATFMAGLGLGSAFAARFVDPLEGSRLPKLYAALEAGIALFALGFPLAIAASSPLLRHFYDASGVTLWLVRIVTAGLFLLVPTTLMGATLPTLTALRERIDAKSAGVARSAAILYAANTFGAVAGSLATGVFLLHWLGVGTTTLVAIILNIVSAALVLTVRVEAPAPPNRERSRELRTVGLAVAALSGFAALGSEVAWARAIVLLIGPTTYGFSFIVSSVIFGIALGSAAASRFTGASKAVSRLAMVQLAAGVASLALIHVIGRLTLPVGELVREHADDIARLLQLELVWVFALLFVPSFLFGASFPLAVAVVAGNDVSESPADVTGRTYLWNTAGAVLGSLVIGFAVVPSAGAEAALYLAASVHVLACAVLVVSKSSLRRWAMAAVLVMLITGLGAVYRFAPRWDRELISGGLYKAAPYLDPREFLDFLRRGELVFYDEDKAATVTVKKVGRRTSLAVDGKVDATNAEDMLTQRMLAHVPLLLHPDPERVLVIGLGGGVTAGSALTHDVASVEAVEISTGVVAASRFFVDVNHEPWNDSRFTLRLADGRNHLLLTETPYDVIISEPSNPWMAGVSSLFTRDFFLLARERLAERGIFCQWAHIYNLSEADLKTIVASFTDAFENASLYVLSEADVLLVGGRNEIGELERLGSDRVRFDLETVGVVGLDGLRSIPVARTPELSEWAEGAARHTDDHPILEFRAARAMHADTGLANRDALLALAETPAMSPDVLRHRAAMLEKTESYVWAFELYRKARDYDGMVRAAVSGGDPARAESALQSVADSPDAAEVYAALGLLYKNVGELDAAVAVLSRSMELAPERRETLILAAEVAGDRDELGVMAGIARSLLSRDPSDAPAAALVAEVSLRSGELEAAARQASAILAEHPDEPRALQVFAIVNASVGNNDAARRGFERLIALEPDAFVHLNNYGRMELEAGNVGEAMLLFERAVDLHPRNAIGYEGLKLAAEAVGDPMRLERALSMLALMAEG